MLKTTGSSLLLKSEIISDLSLHLDDVELLQNAFIVQSLVGPLVRFSNRGRYEPYVAKSWTQSGNSWVFSLHSDLSCEDGQAITAQNFKKSLERSLRKFSHDEIQETPFASLKSMTANGEELIMEFSKPVGKALLEYLAMTPFAFLCESNFDGDKWISHDKFVSSGPYRITHFDNRAQEAKLEIRPEWLLSPSGSFKEVYLAKEEISGLLPTAKVEMTYGKMKSRDSRDSLVLEVPRALLSLRLGIEQDQFFSNRQNRLALQSEVNRIVSKTEIAFENYHRAESFFFGQVSGHEITGVKPSNILSPKKVLQIRGQREGLRPEVDFYQNILFKALSNLGWEYEIITRPVGSAKDFFTMKYDIAFDRSHVDATLDPDFIRLLFKSKLGPRYQDPGKRVANLVDDFDQGRLSYRDFLISFNSIISEEAAILPLYHRGFTWDFSSNVDTSSMSPLMSIVRYEDIHLKDDEKY
ncbi:MAG: hypothetical protein KF802_15345 [Bdellovibrionaceae bacterium]|nr:hypothetical protein [Pseudobdellovibrionaceae bacterium]